MFLRKKSSLLAISALACLGSILPQKGNAATLEEVLVRGYDFRYNIDSNGHFTVSPVGQDGGRAPHLIISGPTILEIMNEYLTKEPSRPEASRGKYRTEKVGERPWHNDLFGNLFGSGLSDSTFSSPQDLETFRAIEDFLRATAKNPDPKVYGYDLGRTITSVHRETMPKYWFRASRGFEPLDSQKKVVIRVPEAARTMVAAGKGAHWNHDGFDILATPCYESVRNQMNGNCVGLWSNAESRRQFFGMISNACYSTFENAELRESDFATVALGNSPLEAFQNFVSLDHSPTQPTEVEDFRAELRKRQFNSDQPSSRCESQMF